MQIYIRRPVLIAAASLAATAAAAIAEPMAAKDAGARYGQALGAIEICYGSKLTAKAEALSTAYQGAELEAFKAQAARIYESWLAVKGCKKQDDPNQCKIIMDKSCVAAEAEIGAKGSALAGLVDFMVH
jgi:hypothetical protein